MKRAGIELSRVSSARLRHLWAASTEVPMSSVSKQTGLGGAIWADVTHSFIKQAGNRSGSILRLLIEKPCYNSYTRLGILEGHDDGKIN